MPSSLTYAQRTAGAQLLVYVKAPIARLAVVAVLLLGCLPSENTLRKRFHDHRAEFDALVEMIRADNLAYVTANGEVFPTRSSRAPHPEILSPARRQSYLSLLNAVGALDGIARDKSADSESICWTVAKRGWALLSGEQEGYCFFVRLPSTDLPSRTGALRKNVYYFSALESGWFICYMWH